MTTQVAETILQQLGGGRFRAMTGARDFLALSNGTGLSFKLPGTPGFVRDGINYVRVNLDATDTYTMEFCRVRAGKMTTKAERSGLYAMDLQHTFRSITGLDTFL